jgi:amidase
MTVAGVVIDYKAGRSRPQEDDMLHATREFLYFEIGADNKPTLHVKPGEPFQVETQINRGPWLDGHPDRDTIERTLRGPNPTSGCVYVEGARPGQILVVNIGDFDLDAVGFTSYWGNTGAMPGWLGPSGVGPQQKVVKIEDGYVAWSGQLKLPVSPMLGVVGVAMEHARWPNTWAGTWGGNMDIQEVTTGASVYLPISVPGALLHIGDMHAIQGDGEICGAGGVEAGGKVKISCTLVSRPSQMTWPRITNETHIITTAQGRPAEDAFRLALVEMILWLEEDYGLSRGEAYLLLGQVLEARCTQFVNPTFTYICKVNRRYLPRSPGN